MPDTIENPRPRVAKFYSLSATTLCTLAALTWPAISFSIECGMDETASNEYNGNPAYNIDPEQPTRALVLFVKFQDDTGNPDSCYQTNWPASLGDTIPVWSDSLLSTSSTRVLYLQPSVSDYFDEMSRTKHWVYGDVVNKLGTSGLNGKCYHVPYDMDQWGSGVTRYDSLNSKIWIDLVAQLDASIDFADYDINPRDGRVDQIWMYYRNFSTTFINDLGAGAIARLCRHDIPTNDTVVVGEDTVAVKITQTSGITLGPNSLEAAIYISAHEHGHYLYSYFGDYSGAWHLLNTGRFSLMGQWSGLASTPNVFERAYLNWTAPTVITSDTLGVGLPNAIASGAGLKVPINGSSTEYFLVENRVKFSGGTASFYETPNDCAKDQGFHELPGSGVLVFHYDLYGRIDTTLVGRTHKYLDVEWAGGMFDALSGYVDRTQPNPIAGLDSLDTKESGGAPGTFFAENQTMSIFTPYSNPSTHGYKDIGGGVWQQKVPSGINLLKISPKQDQASLDVVFSDTSKAYHVGPDVATTIWKGTIYLTSDVTVDSTAHLQVDDATGGLSTDILFRKDYDSQNGGASAGHSELIVASGGQLTIQGTSTQPIEFKSAAASPDTADWYGIRLRPSASASLTYADVAYGNWGISAEATPLNLFIANSKIHHNQYYGVYGEALSDTIEIRDSEVYQNSLGGICLVQKKKLFGLGYMRNHIHRNKIYENGIPYTGYDIELYKLMPGTNTMTDVLDSNVVGSVDLEGKFGVLISGGGTGSGSHQATLYGDTLRHYLQDALSFSYVDIARVRKCWIKQSGRALAVGFSSLVSVDTTKFEGSNVTHVWNDDGASTVLGDGSNGSLSKGYNNFYRVVAPATVMITNEDSDSLKAENNWWDYTGCDSLAPPDNRFVGPVDPFPRRCSEGSLMRRVGDISGDFGDGAGIAGRALRLIVLPNPLAASAMIRYEVPGSQAMSRSVDLSIYDVRGNRVSSPVHRRQETGVYELRWCETASDGSTIPAGIYFVRLTVDGEVRTAKVVVVR